MEDIKDNEYEDIINLPHYEPKYHPRMSIFNRSAQFAPFAALVGYEEAVEETARITDKEIELNDDLKNFIDMKLQMVAEHIKENQNVTILYFDKDKRKKGGKYTEYKGVVKKIDLIEHKIIFKDRFKIDLKSIIDVNAEFIKELN